MNNPRLLKFDIINLTLIFFIISIIIIKVRQGILLGGEGNYFYLLLIIIKTFHQFGHIGH